MLFEAFERRGVRCEHIDDRTIVYRVGKPLPGWDAALNRSISATTRQEVSRIFAAQGMPVTNALPVVQVCDNKIATSIRLHAAGLPTPPTAFALDPAAGPRAVEAIGYPAVVKSVNGSWGRGLAKVADSDAAEAVFGLRAQLPSPQQRLGYVQQFIPGRDIRVLVVGGTALAAMERESDHWVRNTARGGRVRPVKLDEELAGLAERAADAVGGGVLGVDILQSPDEGYVVLEVNAAPEFHGLSEAHPELDLAGAVADHVLTEVA